MSRLITIQRATTVYALEILKKKAVVDLETTASYLLVDSNIG